MPDAYTPGPLEAPLLRRSQYLAQLLAANQEGGQSIRGGYGELGARLLAQALTQWQANRTERRLTEARAGDRASNPIAQGFENMFGGGLTNVQPPGPADGIGTGAPLPSAPTSQTPVTGMAAALGSPTRSTLGDPVPPPPPSPKGLDTGTQDMMARLLMGEAPPQGQQAVANVVLNRSRQSGMTPQDVISAPHQFEPYGNRQTWQRLQNVQPDSPQYRQAAAAVKLAEQGDVTNGADHFYSPQVMAGRGGPPAWAQGQGGQDIAGNRFMQLGYQAPPGYQPQPPPNQSVPSAPSPPVAAGAPPAAPTSPPSMGPAGGNQPPQGAQAQGRNAVTQQEIDLARRLMADPRTYQQGLQLAQQLQARAVGPGEWVDDFNPRTGQVIRRNRLTGEVQVQESGARTAPEMVTQNGVQGTFDPNHPERGTTQVPIMPGAMNRSGDAGSFGLNAPQGTNITVDPYNRPSVVNQPPPGMTYQGGRNQGIPGSGQDITAAPQRVPALMEAQSRLRPLLDQARDLFQNINAVRVGIRSNSGEGDLAIANGLQHLMDAGIVREEDMRNQARALGIQGDVMQIMGYLRGGGRLNDPAVRERFGRLAESLYQPRLDMLRSQVMGQQPLLDQYGAGSFDLVVPPSLRQDYGWENPQQGPQNAQPQQRQQGPYPSVITGRPRRIG